MIEDQSSLRTSAAPLDSPYLGNSIPTAVDDKSKKRSGSFIILDEHERIGKDAPMKIGLPWRIPATPEAYSLSLNKVTTGPLALLTILSLDGIRDFLSFDNQSKASVSEDVSKWKQSQGMKVQTGGFPLYDDIRVPAGAADILGLHPMFSKLNHILSSSGAPPKVNKGGAVSPGKCEEAHTPIPCGEDEEYGDSGDVSSPLASIGDNIIEIAKDGFENSFKPEDSELYQMHERVWKWRDTIELKLKECTSFGNFIITDYVDKISCRVGKLFPDAEVGGVKSVSFRDLVYGQERHEICRMFLTTLVLANKHDLIVENSEGDIFLSGGDILSLNHK